MNDTLWLPLRMSEMGDLPRLLEGKGSGGIEDGVDLDVLVEGFHLAGKALKADNDLQYVYATALYRQAAEKIKAAIISATSQHQERLLEVRKKYMDRCLVLDGCRPDEVASVQRLQEALQQQNSTTKRQMRISRKLRKASLSVIPFVEFEQPPTACEMPPLALPRRPFWLLRVLKKILNSGGYFTPGIYVPQEVWRQKNAKVDGYDVKISALQDVYNVLNSLKDVPLPTDGNSINTYYQRTGTQETISNFQNELNRCTSALLTIQNGLHRSFAFISPVDKLFESMVSESKETVQTGGIGSSLGVALSGVVNIVSKAVDRTARSVLARRCSSEELEKLALVAASVCENSQFLDGWLTYFQIPDIINCPSGGAKPPGASSYDKQVSTNQFLSSVPFIHLQLMAICSFLRKVVAELVVVDMRYLLLKYLRKQRRAFVRHLNISSDEEEEEEEFTTIGQTPITRGDKS